MCYRPSSGLYIASTSASSFKCNVDTEELTEESSCLILNAYQIYIITNTMNLDGFFCLGVTQYWQHV